MYYAGAILLMQWRVFGVLNHTFHTSAVWFEGFFSFILTDHSAVARWGDFSDLDRRPPPALPHVREFSSDIVSFQLITTRYFTLNLPSFLLHLHQNKSIKSFQFNFTLGLSPCAPATRLMIHPISDWLHRLPYGAVLRGTPVHVANH